jgi:alanyl-tRNA synthetase
MVTLEEERFRETLEGGLKILSDAMKELHAKGEGVLPGTLLFKLYDTYGFPVDLVADVAREHAFQVDEPGFEAAMEDQKAKGRAAWRGEAENDHLLSRVNDLTSNGFSTNFAGYETLFAEGTPKLLFRDGVETDSANVGENITLVFAHTPFYASSGGQESDIGTIVFPHGLVQVNEVQKAPGSGVFLHRGVVENGRISVDENASLLVDQEHREQTANNHSATHLLHKALRRVLGEHVRQAGSSVSAERLRFDFTHFAPIYQKEIEDIEALVNLDIEKDFPVETTIMGMDDAVRSGAMALFEERYGEKVRVVSMGDSRELCGGTHTTTTGKIGIFLISSEGSVSSGVRRVECHTGIAALRKIQDERRLVSTLSSLLKASPAELPERLEKLLARNRELEKSGPQIVRPKEDPSVLAARAQTIGGMKVLPLQVKADSPKALRELSDRLREILGPSSLLALGAASSGKALLLVSVGKDLVGRYHAGDLISQMAPLVGGKGGGRPDLAQAGGPGATSIEKALEAFLGLVNKS